MGKEVNDAMMSFLNCIVRRAFSELGKNNSIMSLTNKFDTGVIVICLPFKRVSDDSELKCD